MSWEGGTPHNWGADPDAIARDPPDQPGSALNATARPRPAPSAPVHAGTGRRHAKGAGHLTRVS
ncbi:hypothetical protein Saso_45110 [Streptomyces asoensis]|uniref:Uncharacterized protein n=1 Tax=Streptomyces asoensis TaxID=249586 RepID=A0ABQ3S411_9ACTN|nr:hypothetical protein GCM10010496_50820 [Streptomyces asoensis]GHI62861.1 hypothetical protein Saso_45110 [Streptomyces asoensis]